MGSLALRVETVELILVQALQALRLAQAGEVLVSQTRSQHGAEAGERRLGQAAQSQPPSLEEWTLPVATGPMAPIARNSLAIQRRAAEPRRS